MYSPLVNVETTVSIQASRKHFACQTGIALQILQGDVLGAPAEDGQLRDVQVFEQPAEPVKKLKRRDQSLQFRKALVSRSGDTGNAADLTFSFDGN